VGGVRGGGGVGGVKRGGGDIDLHLEAESINFVTMFLLNFYVFYLHRVTFTLRKFYIL
jgi:hypothetical protein